MTNLGPQIIALLALIYYTTNVKASCLLQTITATSGVNYITSPSYPNTYPSNTNCEWHISTNTKDYVISLIIEDFILDGDNSNCSTDYVAIYEGSTTASTPIMRLCGTVIDASDIDSKGSELTVVFHSDSNRNYKGFKIGYRHKNSKTYVTPSTGSCLFQTITTTSTIKYITSPNYPNTSYPSNTDCEWQISTKETGYLIILTVEEFILDGENSNCRNDYVAVYEGATTFNTPITRLCGTVINALEIESNRTKLTVVFHSDSTRNNKGFKIGYRHKNPKADTSGDLSVGAIIGISLGSFYFIVLVVYIAIGVYLCCKY